jgi:hypothetical protein
LTADNLLLAYENTYESHAAGYSNSSVIKTSFEKHANHVEMVDTGVLYAASFQINPVAELISADKDKILRVSFKIRSHKVCNFEIVLQLDSANALNYGWISQPMQLTVFNQWKNFNFYTTFPEINSMNDQLKIYIWNINKDKFYIDDFNIEFYK